MTIRNHIPSAVLLAASIFNQNRPLLIEVDRLALRRLACTTLEDKFGVQSFQSFKKLRRWSTQFPIEYDRLGRPFAVGYHDDDPFQVALGATRFKACVWIPTNTAAANTSDVQVETGLGGLNARSLYIGNSIENSWLHAYSLIKQLPGRPGHFDKDPQHPGWWEHYQPVDWDHLIEARIPSAWIGFPVESTEYGSGLPTLPPGFSTFSADDE
eukprot:Gregarina_sp_Poly_1__1691@NODE_1434_length_4160_cov_162_480332_g182_i2_p2_GENE_NODE_1434_length_4160_cov_162_480332_g182_i2NODE_1434_length_4160_cov_162_480332_g182_i2_p2_ORF_typecomplete_len212_score23_26_NODE_1434_length_4160_cov_162_480332_g182_i213351970